MRTAPAADSGFTLLELMITVGLAAVIAAIAVPNMRDFIRNNRLAGTANDLLRSIQVARSEAIKRQSVVAVCASAAPDQTNPTCSNGSFTGWFVFEDGNKNWQRDATEAVVERHAGDGNVSVVNNNNGVISYSPTGFANTTAGQTPTNRIVICDARGNLQVGANSVARALIIESTGRTRVSRDYTDVGEALSDIGGTCP